MRYTTNAVSVLEKVSLYVYKQSSFRRSLMMRPPRWDEIGKLKSNKSSRGRFVMAEDLSTRFFEIDLDKPPDWAITLGVVKYEQAASLYESRSGVTMTGQGPVGIKYYAC